MEFYDNKDKQIISFLKTGKTVAPSRVVLERVFQELRKEEMLAERSKAARGSLFDRLFGRFVFAGFLVLLAVVTGVKLMTPAHVAVASEIAALELESDEIGGAIEHADIVAGEASVYELDYIATEKTN